MTHPGSPPLICCPVLQSLHSLCLVARGSDTRVCCRSVSNGRFRDDEVLVSHELTQGRKAIWVRTKFTPVNRPLFPGYPIGDRAWSEIRYTAYWVHSQEPLVSGAPRGSILGIKNKMSRNAMGCNKPAEISTSE